MHVLGCTCLALQTAQKLVAAAAAAAAAASAAAAATPAPTSLTHC
jgi:hypothetical protein